MDRGRWLDTRGWSDDISLRDRPRSDSATGDEPQNPDELAARFHHRLVQIHPFPNGNGRHGRIATDYLLLSMGRPAFTWGRNLDVAADELRRSYRRALQRADTGHIDDLLAFCRT